MTVYSNSIWYNQAIENDTELKGMNSTFVE